MGISKLLAILLIVGGALALAYGGFSYTQETHQMDLGALHMSIDEKRRINIPVWAGVGAIAIGGVLLLVGRER